MVRKETFRNPVIKGGYPDPSVCRVGDVYYMVTSSFYYFPGLPVFRSRDLVHWEQIANAISRPEQLDFRNCDSSEGLWAATIRYDGERFYIVNTLDVEGRTYRYNFIITAEDPSGPWSDAVIIEGADGIDPSLFFDKEGRMWYCGNQVPQEEKYPAHKQIYVCELDKKTFQFVGERHVIYDGNVDHSLFMEGPHIYEIDGTYYLLTACGGTQTNHCVNICRSEAFLGPYEPCPRNPIVTNRGLRLNNSIGVSVTGHGDLVETQKGEWYMVLLGIRPYEKLVENYEKYQPRKWIRKPDRNKNAQFNLGREVFLIPMAWDYDGWPLVDNENGLVNLEERRPDLPWYRAPIQSRIDHFEEESLGMQWCMRRPSQNIFFSLTDRFGYLRLKLQPVRAEDQETPSLLVRRQQHNDFLASTAMEFVPKNEGDEAGMIVAQNEQFAFLLVRQRKDGRDRLACIRIAGGCREELAVVELSDGNKEPIEEKHRHRLYLHMEGAEGSYSFYYGLRERQRIPVALELDGSLLSTLVADGYVGTYLGMYASGTDTAAYADFDWFSYEAAEE